MPAEKYDFKKYLETLRMSGFQITSFMYSAEELEKPEVIAQVIRNIQNVTNCSREVAIYLTELTKRSGEGTGYFFPKQVLDSLVENNRGHAGSIRYLLGDPLEEYVATSSLRQKLYEIAEQGTQRDMEYIGFTEFNDVVMGRLKDLEQLEKKVHRASLGWRGAILRRMGIHF